MFRFPVNPVSPVDPINQVNQIFQVSQANPASKDRVSTMDLDQHLEMYETRGNEQWQNGVKIKGIGARDHGDHGDALGHGLFSPGSTYEPKTGKN